MDIRIKDFAVLFVIIIVFSCVAIGIKNKFKEKELLDSTTMGADFNENLDTAVNIAETETGTINENIGNIENNKVENKNKNKNDDIIVIKSGSVGVIVIPSINVRAQIKDGTDDETLKNYVGRFKTSADFGTEGNLTLAAHNNVYTQIFRNLHNLKNGSEVKIITKTNEYIYKVTSQTVVDPSDNNVLLGTNKKEITLITCTSNAKARVVVKGELSSQRNL